MANDHLRRSLESLASGMADRRVTLRVRPGATPSCDIHRGRITLPALPDGAKGATEILPKARAWFAHEIGEARHRRVGDRVARNLQDGLLKNVLNAVGDGWINSKMADEYSGAGTYIRKCNRSLAPKLTKKLEDAPVTKGSVVMGLAVLAAPCIDSADDIPGKVGDYLRRVMPDLLARIPNVTKADQDEEAHVDLCKEITERIRANDPQDAPENEPDEPGEPQDSDEDADEDADEGEGSGDGESADDEGDDEGEGEPVEADEGDDEGESGDSDSAEGEGEPVEADEGEADNADEGAQADASDEAGEDAGEWGDDAPTNLSDALRDELEDALEEQSDPSEATIEESHDNPYGFDPVEVTTEGSNQRDMWGSKEIYESTFGHLHSRLRRALTAPAPDYVRFQRRGSVDPQRVAALATGRSNVLRRRVRDVDTSTHVVISVDASGSMDNIIGWLAQSVCGFADAIIRAGGTVHASTWTTELMKRYSFRETVIYDERSKALGKPVYMGAKQGTPLTGATIRARNRAIASNAARKVVVLFSDGESSDTWFYPTGMATKAVERMEKAGVAFIPVALTDAASQFMRGPFGDRVIDAYDPATGDAQESDVRDVWDGVVKAVQRHGKY